MIITPKIKFKRKPEKVYREVKGETYILDDVANSLGILNSSASYLWKELGKWKNVNELAKSLTEEFDISEIRAKKDIKEFLDLLYKRKLLILKNK